MSTKSKVKLGSVNKTKSKMNKSKLRSFLKRKSPGPSRDAEGKFVSGSGGLRALKKFNWTRALPLIIVLSLVGGYFVYRSYAGTASVTCQIADQNCLTNSNQSTVVRVYFAVLGRAPANNDLRYWVGRLDGSSGAKLSTTQVTRFFLGSSEFKKRYPIASAAVSNPSPAGNERLVKLIYGQIHNNTASGEEISSAIAQLNDGKITATAMAVEAINTTAAKQALLTKVKSILAVTNQSSTCLARKGNVLNVTGIQSRDYKNYKFEDNMVINASTARWNNSKEKWAIQLSGGTNSCWYGGKFSGAWDDTSSNVTWENPYHHSGAITVRSRNFLVEGLRAHNQGDGVRFVLDAANFEARSVYMSDIHDDCVENDYLHGGIVRDSLFDGCYSGFSAASAARQSYDRDGSKNTWRIDSNLVYMKPYPTVHSKEFFNNRKCQIPNHGVLFKGWNSTYDPAPKVVFKNNIIKYDIRPCVESYSGIIPPQLNFAECKNNTIVYLGPGEFPGKAPTCFKVTKDVNVWNNAVNRWKSAHPDVAQ